MSLSDDDEIEEEFDEEFEGDDGEDEEEMDLDDDLSQSQNLLVSGADDQFANLAKVYKEESAYEVLTRKNIMEKQEEAISQVSNVTKIPSAYCRILLQFYRWDSMKSLNDWSENPAKVSKDAGLPPPEQMIEGSTTTPSKGNDNMCHICYDEFQPNELTSLLCNHRFCNDCWKGYLSIEVKEKKKIIQCPGMTNNKTKCKYVVDELTVFRLLNDKEAEKRYLDALVASYVEDNPSLRWCPGKGCSNAVLLKEVSLLRNEAVTCTCGTSFCFRCGLEEHTPATCNMAADWRKKNSGGDEELDKSLISSISRPCPRCKAAVEKNGGCNHMSCTNCQFHFCWQCMNKFGSGPNGGGDGYSTHKCNGFFKEDSEVLMKKEEWERFVFYSNRYNNHAKSKTQEAALLETAGDTVSSLMDEHSLSWVSAQFYVNAITQLVKNRQVLKYSYVFGYFRPIMTPFVNKNIFENLQVDLERHTEMLAGMVERKTIGYLFKELQNIINQTKIASKVSDGLLNASVDWANPLDEGGRVSQKKSKRMEKEKLKGAQAKKRSFFSQKGSKKKRVEVDEEDDDEEEVNTFTPPPVYNPPQIQDDYVQRRRDDEDRQRRRDEARRQEEQDIMKAIEASKKDAWSNPPDVVDEDWELQMALQASLSGK